jgi:hypothetical protein
MATCKNGGVCKLSLIPSSTEVISWCQCHPGFLGQSCETPVSPCGQLNCLNGGVCRSENDCQCGHEWTGPSCEVMRISDDTTNHHAASIPAVGPVTSHTPPPSSPTFNTPAVTFSENNKQTSGAHGPDVIFLAKFFLFAFLAISACACGIWGRHRIIKSRGTGFSCGTLYDGGNNYHDNTPEKSIAPKMDDDDDDFFSKFISPVPPAPDSSPKSARAPIDIDKASTFEFSPRGTSSPNDTDAAVFLGPPRDEDGHELYNVEIL